jgi:hypothetical protein
VWPLSQASTDATRSPFQLAERVAERRLEIRVGKFSLADFFDVTAVGSDSHLQFLNWAIDNNPAWDYAADTRGYTVAAMAAYHARNWTIRFADALMPTTANGVHLEGNLRRAHAENVEFERRLRPAGRDLTLRLLAYGNHANMGNYREAIAAFLSGQGDRPDVTRHPQTTRSKYGVGVNTDVVLSAGVRAYARAGWNDGRNESYAYTEADRAVSGGFDASGARWRRPLDKIGVAFSIEGLSPAHRDYLALGGVGFMVGDGGLRYGRERVVEAYYTAQVWHGLFVAADLQRIACPGYNADRGPILVGGIRLHVEF